MLESFRTDEEDKRRLCCGVTCGEIGEHTVCVALLDSDCLVLALEVNDDHTVRFSRRADFTADFHPEEASLHCCLVSRTGLIVTGGQDCSVRVWRIDGDLLQPKWRVTLAAELRGHGGPVMALSFHPHQQWLASASKDGTLKIWDAEAAALADRPNKTRRKSEGAKEPAEAGSGKKDGEGKQEAALKLLLCDVPCELEQLGKQPLASPGPKPGGLQCRGCAFSPDGAWLFALRSGRRGATHLVQWALAGAGSAVQALPSLAVEVSAVPCTLLKMESEGSYVAVGGSDGTVAVFDTKTLRALSRRREAHDLPVTGLDFAPPALALSLGLQAVVVSCSADRKLVVTRVGGYSMVFKACTAGLLLLSLCLLLLYSSSLWLLLADQRILQPTPAHLEL
ncbi:WD40-repeat-containing domain protein [Ochromonadaceae sp. CCMP2298]|nr:WD40-repeat-containing domain protein [Ochromonadaceae sp. CCMP2298]